MRIRILLLVVSLLVKITGISAQDISMEQTLSYINGKLGAGNNIEVIHGVIIAKFMQGSELVREDQVMVKLLDPASMSYDPVYRVFSINCKGSAKCVDREILVNRKSTRDYHRLSFPVNLDNKGVEGMKKAFTHMMRLVLEPKYKSSEPFE
jgi:hypothetical protein